MQGDYRKFDLMAVLVVKAGVANQREGASTDHVLGIVRYVGSLTVERLEAEYDKRIPADV